MPEYISRETLRDLMYTEAFDRDTGLQRWDSGLWIRFKLFENCLDAIPAADVVEVVRCADCKYDERCMVQDFVRENRVVPYDKTVFYCADGKRKNGEQE